jgi:curved DNA-binding protein CbpA
MSTRKTHYEVLGVEWSATRNDLDEAYFKAAMAAHPGQLLPDIKEMECCAELTRAYEVLRDPQRRRNYNAGLVERGLAPDPPEGGYEYHDDYPRPAGRGPSEREYTIPPFSPTRVEPLSPTTNTRMRDYSSLKPPSGRKVKSYRKIIYHYGPSGGDRRSPPRGQHHDRHEKHSPIAERHHPVREPLVDLPRQPIERREDVPSGSTRNKAKNESQERVGRSGITCPLSFLSVLTCIPRHISTSSPLRSRTLHACSKRITRAPNERLYRSRVY